MQLAWIKRTFDFNYPTELYPEIISRLLGAPPRLEELIGNCKADILTIRAEERWSIQENSGHLGDAERLWLGRVDDIMSGMETMRPADLSNKLTHNSSHNDKAISELTKTFRTKREKLISRLDELKPEDFSRSAIHPRLNKPMRIVDLCFFAAEHDDFHLTRIRELLIKLI